MTKWDFRGYFILFLIIFDVISSSTIVPYTKPILIVMFLSCQLCFTTCLAVIYDPLLYQIIV